jgi:hypothetical protein
MSNANKLISALGSVDEQREMFLLKFKTISRQECVDLANVIYFTNSAILLLLTPVTGFSSI